MSMPASVQVCLRRWLMQKCLLKSRWTICALSGYRTRYGKVRAGCIKVYAATKKFLCFLIEYAYQMPIPFIEFLPILFLLCYPAAEKVVETVPGSDFDITDVASSSSGHAGGSTKVGELKGNHGSQSFLQ